MSSASVKSYSAPKNSYALVLGRMKNRQGTFPSGCGGLGSLFYIEFVLLVFKLKVYFEENIRS